MVHIILMVVQKEGRTGHHIDQVASVINNQGYYWEVRDVYWSYLRPVSAIFLTDRITRRAALASKPVVGSSVGPVRVEAWGAAVSVTHLYPIHSHMDSQIL